MSKTQLPINEMTRAAVTVALTIGVATAYFAVMPSIFDSSRVSRETVVEQPAVHLPPRPPGGRRWRSSNAEQSLPTLSYFGENDHWGRNRAMLEGALSLFQMGGTFSSAEIAGGKLHVSVSEDYLANYLTIPFLGGGEPMTFSLAETDEKPISIGPVLARAFGTELLAQR